MHFDWDPTKDALNRLKHGIGFDEAKDVFAPGSHRLDLDDDAHSDDEIRRFTMKTSKRPRARVR